MDLMQAPFWFHPSTNILGSLFASRLASALIFLFLMQVQMILSRLPRPFSIPTSTIAIAFHARTLGKHANHREIDACHNCPASVRSMRCTIAWLFGNVGQPFVHHIPPVVQRTRANSGMSATVDARMAPWERSMAGLAGGACSAVLLHPLDVLKTRRQVALTRGEASMANALVTMARREGRRGLYAGLSPSLLGASMAWSAYMTLFDLLRNAWSSQRTAEKDLACAYAAGACVAVLTNPIWLVKTRMQLGQTHGKGVWRAMRDIQRKEGWKACWRGSAPAVAMAAHGALQLSAYEGIKRTWMGHEDEDVGALDAGVMAATSKILASTATYPMQVVRTHMQKEGGLNIRHAMKTTWENGGARGFYAGWVPHIARVVPSAAITFVVYEATITLLRKMHPGES